MTTLDKLFQEYLSAIEPSEAAVDRAVAAHKELRKDLEQDEKYGSFVERTLLSGSYGRGTAILYIKDVDVIIQTILTLEDLRSQKQQSETEQECLLRLTQEAIKRTGRAAKTRKRRRSIHVKLPAEINDMGEEQVPELTMDIVPVLIQTDKDQDPMTIADKDLGAWYDTYPITQLSDSIDRNDESSRIGDRHHYKPLVKLFKAWKQVHFRSSKTPKGFVLECLTAKYHNPEAEHWAEAVRDLFQNIRDAWPYPDYLSYIPEVPEISDSAPYQIPIAKTVEEAQKVLRKIHQHLALVNQAIEEAETDIARSAKTLQRVFGQDRGSVRFPLPDDNDDSDICDDEEGNVRKSSPYSVTSRSDVREAPEFA